MPLTLDTAEAINTTITDYEINSFALDMERQEIVVAYDKLDSNGAKLGEEVLILDGPDFLATISDANTIATVDVYGPFKEALYNQIVAKTGKTGSVV